MPYLAYLGLVAVGASMVALVARHPGRSTPRIGFACFVLGAVALLCLYSTGRGTPFGDFDKAYYPAGRLVLTAPAELYDCARDDGLCFVNVPIVALLFAPFSMLPLAAAHLVVATCGIAAVVAAVWLLCTLVQATGWQRYAVIALVVLNGPLFYSLRLANLTHVVLAVVVLAMLWLLSGKEARAGSLLALGALIKPPLLIWLPYFVIRRRWRAAGWMTAGLLGLVAASVAFFGVGLHAVWVRQFVTGISARPVGAYNVQSINGFLVRLTMSGTLVNWRPVPVGPGFRIAQGLIAGAVISGVLVTAMLAGPPGTRTARLLEQAAVLCVLLLLSPISWTHYYCLLLVPMAAYLTETLPVPRHGWWMVVSCFAGLLVSLPVTLWVPAHPVYGAIVARVLLSHYFFGCVLMLSLLLVCAVRPNDRSSQETVELRHRAVGTA
jgi:hypothetical protein